MTPTKCRECQASIMMLKTVNGKSMPVNAEPVAHGNLEVTGDQCRVIKTHEVYTGVRYLSHFATCTKAAQFRKKKPNDN